MLILGDPAGCITELFAQQTTRRGIQDTAYLSPDIRRKTSAHSLLQSMASLHPEARAGPFSRQRRPRQSAARRSGWRGPAGNSQNTRCWLGRVAARSAPRRWCPIPTVGRAVRSARGSPSRAGPGRRVDVPLSRCGRLRAPAYRRPACLHPAGGLSRAVYLQVESDLALGE